MLHQMSGLSLKSPLRLFTALVFHLLLIHSCKGQNQLIGSSQPIVATVGDDIILPCHLKPAVDVTEDTLEWTRPDLNPRYVHIWRSGEHLADTHPSYKGRTSLITEELKHGNISLKLSKVKLSDEGTYKCHMPWIDKQSLVELVVGAASSPDIRLAGIDTSSSRVVLQCESKGWYPEPEVFWLDGERKLLSAGPTETVRGPDDLYTVISRVTVEKKHSNNFTCRVQQNHINQTRETHIIVPDEFFMFQSDSGVSINIGLAVSLAVSLAFCILLIFAVVFLVWRQNKRKKTRSCMDRTERGDSNETKMQVAEAAERKSLMKTQRVSENNKETKCFNDQQLQQEQQRREEAENKVENMKQELENVKQELENVKQEKRSMKHENMKQELENVKQEKRSMKQENMKVKTQHAELQRLRSELETKKKKEFNDQQQLQQEQQRRKEAENKVENMKQEKRNMKQELENVKQQLENVKKENMKIKTQNDELQRLRSELETKKKELEKRQNPYTRFSRKRKKNEQLEQVKEVKTEQGDFDMNINQFNKLLKLEKNMDQEPENTDQENMKQHQQHKGKR